MRKIAVMVLLSMVFVSVVQSVSFAIGETYATSDTTIYEPLPGGGFKVTEERVIEPSTTGGVIGAGAGAATGAAIGSIVPGLGTAVGGAIGAIAGGIAGWIWGPAD